jgi:hypothetical protein
MHIRWLWNFIPGCSTSHIHMHVSTCPCPIHTSYPGAKFVFRNLRKPAFTTSKFHIGRVRLEMESKNSIKISSPPWQKELGKKQGPVLRFWKYFCRKSWRKIWRVSAQNKAIYVSRKKLCCFFPTKLAIFRKSPKKNPQHYPLNTDK